MSEASFLSTAELQQQLEHRNGDIKDTVTGIYLKTAKGILMQPPFAYSESISLEVADGIVNYGDTLSYNAEAEEDGEAELEELNNIGEEFQALTDNVALKLYVSENRNKSENIDKEIMSVYPMPMDDYYLIESKAGNLARALEQIRNFLKTKACQGLTATISVLGDCNEDGVVFSTGQTVPVQVLESQISQMLQDSGGQLLPMAVDLVIGINGKQLHVSQICPGNELFERHIVTLRDKVSVS